MTINKFNLSRSIPEDVKRSIRKSCGFGCVFCGLWLYTYEHIDPPFSDAKEHDPQRMCLLCPNHHTEVTKKIRSKDEVKEALKSPYALRLGFSHHSEFTRLRRPVRVLLGPITFIDPKEVLKIDQETILSLAEDLDGGPLKLNGKFYDKRGELILQIKDNEWKAFTNNWDVEQVGNRLIIREKLREISLTVITESNNVLIFDDVHIHYHGAEIKSKFGEKISIIPSQKRGVIENMTTVVTGGPILIDSNLGGIQILGGSMMSFFVLPQK